MKFPWLTFALKLALLMLIAGLALPATPGAVQGGQVKARLVNKKMAEEGPVSFATGQVEVRLPEGQTKLLPYRSYLEPRVVRDRIFIFPTKNAELTRIIIYHARTEQTKSFRLPLDLDPYFGSPSFSPDGTKIAYYQVKEKRVVVRSWPGLKLLRRSSSYSLRPTDVPPEPPAWKTRQTVEFDPYFFMPERRISFKFPR